MPTGQLPNNQTTFNIFLGDNVTMTMGLIQDGCQSNLPVDLTNCSALAVFLTNADGSTTMLSLGGGQVVISSPPVLGQFTVAISSAVSALLNVGENQNIDVTFTIGTEIFTVRYYQALSVFEVA